ncbi:MAG: methyltransferase domain-containing protein [Thermomicrobiales bacterium]
MPQATATTRPCPPDVGVDATIRLSFALDLTDDGPCIIARTDEPDGRSFTYGTDIQHIVVPLAAGSVREIVALDVLEHAYDEQAFLTECARLLAAGGVLRLRVPVDGLTGWLDAINLFRYLAETTGLAPEPKEPVPTGWHRHYRERDLARILSESGFTVDTLRRVNPGLAELPHAAGLVVGEVLLKRPDTERTLFRLRQRVAGIENALPAGPLATRLEINATRTPSPIARPA